MFRRVVVREDSFGESGVALFGLFSAKSVRENLQKRDNLEYIEILTG